VTGTGPLRQSKSDEVRAALNEIRDPCSVAAQTPVGLWDMGLITAVDIGEGGVEICVRPTFPGCLFVGHFDREIRARLAALPWCSSVRIAIDSSTVWTEADMAPGARRSLERRRAAARAAAGR
jgi:metal-sulfur cluster biosynthetic enzyme